MRGAPGKLGFVFPGQGSQFVGMGRELRDRWPIAGRVFAEADDVLGLPLSRLLFEGPEPELRRTANCQPAILAHGVAVLRVLEAETGLVPDVACGHSLGEITALVCAGALELAGALRLVRRRGLAMQEAVPEGEGAMLAVTGLSAGEVEDLCREAAQGRVAEPASYNAPEQIVVAGHADAVERVARLASPRGARAELLRVSAPFHCELMRPAAQALADWLERTSISEPRLPVLANVDAAPHREPARIRERLLRQIHRPVRFLDCVRAMRSMGVSTLVEIGSAGVLGRLIERIDAGIESIPLSTPSQIEAILPRARGEVWSGARREVDLARFTRCWRDEAWVEHENGMRRRGDGLRVILPGGEEWRFDDPDAHGL
jgi:[acyl-carrier-protein] S-malonyltransferase